MKLSETDKRRTDLGYETTDLRIADSAKGYAMDFALVRSPTSNCQLFSIACIQNAMDTCSDDELKQLVKECGKKIEKSLCLIDVKHFHGKRIQSIFGENIPCLPYTSSNDSLMKIFIIDVRKL